MKIGVVNGSPRKRGSASENIIGALRERLGKAPEYALCNAMSQNGREIVSALLGCDALVFVFPLYLDGAPSHLLRFLEESREQISGAAPAAVVYAVVNNGFYEPAQNILAINTIKSFCVKSGLKWGQGVCAGGGGRADGTRRGHISVPAARPWIRDGRSDLAGTPLNPQVIWDAEPSFAERTTRTR